MQEQRYIVSADLCIRPFVQCCGFRYCV